MKSTKVKQQKEKRNFKNKNKLSYLLHNIKQTNVYIIEVPQEERREKGTERKFEDIIVKIFQI